MSIQAISNAVTTAAAQTARPTAKPDTEHKKNETKAPDKAVSDKSNAADTGVIYEPSADAKADSKKTDTVTDNSQLIAKLKADADARVAQLRDLVEKMMTQQGKKIGEADDMWKFLASGDFTVDAETKLKAQQDIAEDGYWGVEQTSDRIVDFAKALSGNDKEKAQLMIDAFKKGFQEATKSWGKELPDISQRTYDAVIQKLQDWGEITDDTATDSDLS